MFKRIFLAESYAINFTRKGGIYSEDETGWRKFDGGGTHFTLDEISTRDFP